MRASPLSHPLHAYGAVQANGFPVQVGVFCNLGGQQRELFRLSQPLGILHQALQALAKQSKPDPWLVLDELCYRRRSDAATAFAQASPVDAEKMQAYEKTWSAEGDDKSARDERLQAMFEAYDAKRWAAA